MSTAYLVTYSYELLLITMLPVIHAVFDVGSLSTYNYAASYSCSVRRRQFVVAALMFRINTTT